MTWYDDMKLKPRAPFRVASQEDYSDTLSRVVDMWAQNEYSTLVLESMLGAYVSKWGEDAQTSAVAATIIDWKRSEA